MRAGPSNLPVRHTSQYTVVKMPEEIDATNSDGVREQLLTVLNDSPGPVIIDMTGTLFCDSTALRALVRARTRAGADDRRLHAAARPKGSVRRIFELTAMYRLIPVHDDLDTAIAAAVGAAEDGEPAESPASPAPEAKSSDASPA
jgi:anti-sigma B factor antagonist